MTKTSLNSQSIFFLNEYSKTCRPISSHISDTDSYLKLKFTLDYSCSCPVSYELYKRGVIFHYVLSERFKTEKEISLRNGRYHEREYEHI